MSYYNANNPHWGFDPSGNPMGGSGFEGGLGGHQAPSKPYGPQNPNFGDPVQATNRNTDAFVKRFDKRYEAMSSVEGRYVDPAEINAQVADYQDGVADPWAQVRAWEDEATRVMESGNPQRGLARDNTAINYQALVNPATGLAPEKAAQMRDMLAKYDPAIVEGIQVPVQHGLPQISNEIGVVVKGERGLSTYKDQVLRATNGPDLFDAAARVAAAQPSYTQTVDENGVVNKYAPGTGPYDAPGHSRPGGITGAQEGTLIHNQEVSAKAMRRSLNSASPSVGSDVRTGADDVPVQGGGRVSIGHILGGVGLGLLGVLGLSFVAQGASE